MLNEKQLQSTVDKSKLAQRMAIIIGCGSLIAILVVTLTGVTRSWAGLDIYSLGLVPYIMATFFSAGALVYSYFCSLTAQEEQEKLLLKRRKEDTRALDTSEDVRFTTGRAFNNFKRYAPFIMSLMGAIVLCISIYSFMSYWKTRLEAPVPIAPLKVAFLTVSLLLISLFAGAFCVGQSREKEFRWLRAVGAWLMLACIVNVLATTAAIMYHFEQPVGDKYFKNAILVLYAILAVEFILNFVSEFYRPRTLREDKPVFESRLLALFTEPGGVMRNLADTLDYQFGFKVSKTWIYSFVEYSLARLVIFWLIVLWLFTMIAEVGPDEVGVRERLGKRVSDVPIVSGVYLKLPWPFEKIARYPIYRIHEILVGPEMKKDGKGSRPEVILWTKSHYAKESKFLVAAQKDYSDGKGVPVSFLGASFPIQYRIKKDKVIDFAYHYQNAPLTLKNLSEQVVAKYLASVDFLKTMCVNREKTVFDLQKLIQDECDDMNLGVEIVFVNFHDAHPPVEKVAPAYQDVIGAMEEKESTILAAKADEVRMKFQSQSQSKTLLLEAEGHRESVMKIAAAEVERFQKQYKAYSQMPSMFKLRAYLEVLEKDSKDVRKYILSSSMKDEIFEINLEEKTKWDMIDTDFTEIMDKK